jgi:predicted DNA-binding protein YlxM (UPF0122 family)
MYGYGYHYPRAPQIAYYDDPNYRFKWDRAAIGNRAIAQKSDWVNFLKKRGAYEAIGEYLRELGDEYRVLKGGVKESTKKGAKQRIKKLERAIAALQDQALIKDVAADLEENFNQQYVTDTIGRLQKEIERLKATIAWKPPAQQQQQLALTTESQPSQQTTQTATLKKRKGQGLLSGLGYGYGYFY